MTTTIQETVRTALAERGLGSYADSAGPVIAVLVERERDISEQLLTYASDMGADPSDVREQLTRLGMAVPPEEDEEEDDDDDDERDDVLGRVEAALIRVESGFGRINERLDSLTAFARRNGYSG